MRTVLLLLVTLLSSQSVLCRSEVPSRMLERPRLVVLISIDQFRADYLTRHADLFLPAAGSERLGGFRWLMEEGAWYSDARHDHFPLFTGPGHAAIATGAHPGCTGIVGNFRADPATGAEIYCVRDPESPIVGPGAEELPQPELTGVSPRSLLASTIGDELEIASGGAAKVWGLAFKDRAAILLAGHLADGAVWLDAGRGAWVSSRWYFREGGLPPWTARGPSTDWNAIEWSTDIAEDVRARVWSRGNPFFHDKYALGASFPHPLRGGPQDPTGERAASYYLAYGSSALGNAYVFETALRLIEAEQLGQDDCPDLLGINLSSNDYLGHLYGPDSAEALVMTVQTDRLLADFMSALAERVPGGRQAITFVVTADHGVAPIPEQAQASGLGGGRYSVQELQAQISEALGRELDSSLDPRPSWLCSIVESNVYLNHRALRCSRSEAAEIAAGIVRATTGIAAAYTRDDLLHGRVPPTEAARRVAASYHDGLSGEVVFYSKPYWIDLEDSSRYGNATTHGTPYRYDTCVPILFGGCGVRSPGRYRERVSTLDIAATLADLLGVLPPSCCEGRVLPHAREPAR